MTFGYREMTAAQGSLLSLTSVVFSALLAHTLFGEALPPTTLLGGALIREVAALALVSSGLFAAPRAAAQQCARFARAATVPVKEIPLEKKLFAR